MPTIRVPAGVAFSYVPTFNWKELDGKTLTIHVEEDSDCTSVSGVDVKTHVAYLLCIACNRG